MVSLTAHEIKLLFVNLFDDDFLLTTMRNYPAHRAVSLSLCNKQRIYCSFAFESLKYCISANDKFIIIITAFLIIHKMY